MLGRAFFLAFLIMMLFIFPSASSLGLEDIFITGNNEKPTIITPIPVKTTPACGPDDNKIGKPMYGSCWFSLGDEYAGQSCSQICKNVGWVCVQPNWGEFPKGKESCDLHVAFGLNGSCVAGAVNSVMPYHYSNPDKDVYINFYKIGNSDYNCDAITGATEQRICACEPWQIASAVEATTTTIRKPSKALNRLLFDLREFRNVFGKGLRSLGSFIDILD